MNGDSVDSFDNGDFATYVNIWFGSPEDTSRLRLRFSALNNGGRIEVRLGGTQGEIIGQFYREYLYSHCVICI